MPPLITPFYPTLIISVRGISVHHTIVIAHHNLDKDCLYLIYYLVLLEKMKLRIFTHDKCNFVSSSMYILLTKKNTISKMKETPTYNCMAIVCCHYSSPPLLKHSTQDRFNRYGSHQYLYGTGLTNISIIMNVKAAFGIRYYWRISVNTVSSVDWMVAHIKQIGLQVSWTDWPLLQDKQLSVATNSCTKCKYNIFNQLHMLYDWMDIVCQPHQRVGCRERGGTCMSVSLHLREQGVEGERWYMHECITPPRRARCRERGGTCISVSLHLREQGVGREVVHAWVYHSTSESRV